jgi:GPH family glycoside/pentoside/hexuronide:cation symporter
MSPESLHQVPPEDKVPLGTKVAYGLGGLTDFFFLNVVNAMAVPIFAIALKMDPMLVAVALAIPKVVGAITDPVVGAISDNARTRWGRRKPFILGGGLVGVVLLPLVWMPPFGTPVGMFIWLAVLLGIFAVAYSFFVVPYGALGFQLSTNYDERTRVLAWKGYVQVLGTFGAAWLYWACLHPAFGNEVVGVRWISAAVSLIMLGGLLATVLACHEKVEASARQPKIALWPALKLTLSDRPFLILQATVLIIAVGTGCEGLIGSYVHIYYTCQGSKELASVITGLGGTLTVFSTLAAIPLGLWISTHYGKRTGAIVGLGIALLGICILPFTLIPQAPYLIIVSWVIIALGMPAASLMFGSMTADITDEDELRTGMRREGMYVATGGFLGKIASIITLLIGGWLPRLAGYHDTSVPPDAGQLDSMRSMLIGIQAVAVFAAVLVIWRYPITRSRSEDIRRQLNERKKNRDEGPQGAGA